MALNNIQPDLFRYFLTTSLVTDELLEFAPEDWADSSITIKRDFSNFMGNKREFSLPLGFIKKARSHLRDEFLLNGVMGVGIVRMEILDRSTWVYNPFYTGKVDFGKSDLNSTSIQVNFLDTDIQSLKEAYENTEFEIGFSINDSAIKLPPIKFTENASYFIAAQTSVWTPFHPSRRARIITAGLQDFKIRLGGVSFFSPQAYTPVSNDSKDWIEQPIFEVNSSGLSMVLKMDMLFDVRNPENNVDQRFVIFLSGNKLDPDTGERIKHDQTLYDFDQWGVGVHSDKRDQIVRPIELREGYSYFLSLYIQGPLSSIISVNLKEITMDLSYEDTAPEVLCKSMHPFNLFQRLFSRITGDPNIEVESEFLTSLDHFRITSGDAIRYFGITGYTSFPIFIKTSFSEFFKSMNAVFGLGFDIINGIPTIEKKEYFFNPDLEIIDVGNSRNLNITSSPELIFTDIKVGYAKENYEENWGRQEVNNGQVWKSPVSSGKKTLDLLSPYRADAYGINEIRSRVLEATINNSLDQDLQTDNDVFMVWGDPNSYTNAYSYEDTSFRPPLIVLVPSTWSALTLEQASGYTGIEPNPFYFNWLMTPKRNIRRHSSLLASGLYGSINQDKYLELTQSDKWKELIVNYGGETFNEGINLAVSALVDPLFIPFDISVEAAFPLNFYEEFMAKPQGYITFWHDGSPFKIFPHEISFDLVNRSEFEIKGILCPGQNIIALFS